MNLPIRQTQVRPRFSTLVKRFLDQPGHRRAILCLLGSLYIFLKTGRIVRLLYDGSWGHVSTSVTLFDRDINWSLSEEAFETETKQTWLVAYQPKEGDVVFDVGAGIGSETYVLSKAVGPSGKVISIEAHPETFKCLQRLCEYNRLQNVTPLNLAVHSAETPVMIDDPANHISASIVGTTGGYEVPGTSLDILAEKLGISEIAFIKMNIEGAEKFALQGMVNCIRRTRHISVECHDFLADNVGREELRTKQLVVSFLRDQGFSITWDSEDPRGWIRDTVHGTNQNRIAGGVERALA